MSKTHATLLLLGGLLASGAVAAKPQKHRRPNGALVPSGTGPIKLTIKELDLTKEQLIIGLANVAKPPAPNLYRLTDDRDRHYIAIDSSCGDPDDNGERTCHLLLPSGYGRHRLKSVELHVGGLHGRLVSVDAKAVAAAWDDAQARSVMGIAAADETKPTVAGEGLLIPVGEF